MAGRNTYLWNNLTLSPAQIASALYQAGARDPNLIAQLVSIAQRESSGRAGVHGSTAMQGRVSGDRGLFQINYVHDAKLKAAGIIRNSSDLFDPVTNARAALYLSQNGNPKVVRQLWGGSAQGWVGSGGSLPAPNYGAVQQAQQSGFAQNWARPTGVDTGAGAWPGSGQPGSPVPPITTAWYDQLYRQVNDQLGLDLALTQNSVEYQQQQQEFARQLAGYQQSGLDLQREQLGLENRYQNDIALLNQNLTATQRKANEREWRTIGANLVELQQLAGEGLEADKDRYGKTLQLQKDIRSATQRWIGQQSGFNQRDYQLAQDAITHMVQTEAQRWAEVQRSTGVESGLSRQKQAFIKQGAQEAYAQALKEAGFVEGEQRREATSDAVARGAMSSRGYGEDLGAFAEQRRLAGSAAGVQRDDVLRMSENQLAGELEDIGQRWRAGRISYGDALRQAADARNRATLNRDTNAGKLGNDYRQAWLDYRGAVDAAKDQWGRDYLGYRTDVSNLTRQRLLNNNQYLTNQANLDAQAQQAARTQAYNNALYGTNLAGIQNQSGSYAAQLAQQLAASQYGIDQSYVGGAQAVQNANVSRGQIFGDQIGAINPYQPQPPFGYSPTPPTSSRPTTTPDPYRPRRSASDNTPLPV